MSGVGLGDKVCTRFWARPTASPVDERMGSGTVTPLARQNMPREAGVFVLRIFLEEDR